MIFEKFIELEVKYVDDEYKLLEQNTIDLYNIEKIQDDFYDELRYIKLLQCKYIGLEIPDMTVNYEKTTHSNYNIYDPIYNNVEQRKETEDELMSLYYKMKGIFDNSLSYMEKIVFIDFFIKRSGRESIKNRLRIGNERFKLVKTSCLVKFALGLHFENINKED